MNQKVQQLLDNGQLTIADILEYAQNYMDACDQLDDEQLNKHTVKPKFTLNGDMANEFNDSYIPSEEDYWDDDESDKAVQ